MSEEQDNTVIWPPHDVHDEALVPGGVGEDDFKFLDDLDPDFSQFGGLTNVSSGLDTPMGRLGFGQNPIPTSTAGVSYEPERMTTSYADTVHSTHHQPFEAYQQYQHMAINHPYQIPPTPVSGEMQSGRYSCHMGSANQLVFDAQQVSFTPLVSPAQTPMDGTFALSDYGMTDEFFSPLTSPAIEAQVGFSSTGTTASPVDLDAAEPSSFAPKSTSSVSKRSRRKGSTSMRTAARSVKRSPAMKPQMRRSQASLNSLSLDKIGHTLSQPGQTVALQPSARRSAVSGSDDSVSPEPLSESSMRPPPVPQNLAKSPRPPGGFHPPTSNGPVTPATLMRMPSSQTISVKLADHPSKEQTADEPMEDIMLPDAVTTPSQPVQLERIDTTQSVEATRSTPNMSAKSAKLSATSTPRSAVGKSLSQESFSKPGKIESRGGGGRANKKRQSTSATISPALRPKISPNISPLVAASGPGMPHISAETSALYLASKSNYQNILEGTHLPGVSYPETLAENLTSKRTSHKIAEQGRRNRINLALKEIESLLPSSITGTAGKKDRASSQENEDGEKPTPSGQGTSKASTVEMAIVYIRRLEAELNVTKNELNETKDKLEAAEKKLAEGGSSAESQASEG